MSVALVLAVVGGFEAHAGFGFGNRAAARERIISLIALRRCSHALQRPSAAFGLALGRTFYRVDQINQRGRHFGKAAYFHIALGLVAAAKVAPGRDIDALGADIDISGGRHIGRLLGISAGGLDMHIAAEAADLRFELLDLAAALVLGVFHPAAEIIGVGDLGRADAAADLALAHALAALGGENIDLARRIEGEVVLGNKAAAQDIDIAALGLQRGRAAHGKAAAGGLIDGGLAAAAVVKRAAGGAVVAGVDAKAAAAAAGGLALAAAGEAEIDVVAGV